MWISDNVEQVVREIASHKILVPVLLLSVMAHYTNRALRTNPNPSRQSASKAPNWSSATGPEDPEPDAPDDLLLLLLGYF